MMDAASISDLGFELVQERRDGTRQYTMRPNRFLVYWLLAYPDGTAELTWEHALGEYLASKGLAVSAQDELSLFVFPRDEPRGTLTEGWVRERIDRVEKVLGSVDLARGT